MNKKYKLITVIDEDYTRYPAKPLIEALNNGAVIISAVPAGKGVQYILELNHE